MTSRRWTVALVVLGTVVVGCTSTRPSSESVGTVPAPSATAVTTTGVPRPVTTSPTPADPTTTTTPATTTPTSTTPASTTSVDPATWRSSVTLGAPLGTFDDPVDIDQHPRSAVFYVVEQAGVVQRIDPNGTVLSPPAIDLDDEVRSGGEQGLLGLAFDDAGDQVYLNYTDDGGNTVVAGYAVLADGTFDPASQRVLLQLEQPFRNHNGGEVLVGPDDALWVPTGDGGSSDDPRRLALDPTSRLGKVLRIDRVTGAVEVWASGLRNPWRASFDELTGDLWIADVGQGAWEEISVAAAGDDWARGRNFGWSAFEGTHRFHDDQPIDGHVPPVFEYAHGDDGCSITGGVRYRGQVLTPLWGAYVFSDYCSGRIRALPVADDGTVGEPVELGQMPRVVAVRADTDGELWVVSLDGEIRPLISAERP